MFGEEKAPRRVRVFTARKQNSSFIPATPSSSQGNPAVVGGQLIIIGPDSVSGVGWAWQDMVTLRWDEARYDNVSAPPSC